MRRPESCGAKGCLTGSSVCSRQNWKARARPKRARGKRSIGQMDQTRGGGRSRSGPVHRAREIMASGAGGAVRGAAGRTARASRTGSGPQEVTARPVLSFFQQRTACGSGCRASATGGETISSIQMTPSGPAGSWGVLAAASTENARTSPKAKRTTGKSLLMACWLADPRGRNHGLHRSQISQQGFPISDCGRAATPQGSHQCRLWAFSC